MHNISDCPYCSKPLLENSRFCSHCGQSIHSGQLPLQDESALTSANADAPEPQQTETGNEETLVDADVPIITREHSNSPSIYGDEPGDAYGEDADEEEEQQQSDEEVQQSGDEIEEEEDAIGNEETLNEFPDVEDVGEDISVGQLETLIRDDARKFEQGESDGFLTGEADIEEYDTLSEEEARHYPLLEREDSSHNAIGPSHYTPDSPLNHPQHFYNAIDNEDAIETALSKRSAVGVALGSRDRDSAHTPATQDEDSPLPKRTGMLDSGVQEVTWYKEVEPHPTEIAVGMLPPRPPVMLTQKPRRRFVPSTFFWIAAVVIAVLLFGGVFSIINTLGQTIHGKNQLSLQANPRSVGIGETLTLQGANFTPHGRVGLTRDDNRPIVDTGGSAVITADDKGNFTDTVSIDSDWETGSHLLVAEDAMSHKTASYAVTVTGQSKTPRPPHLLLSQLSLDLGPGDPATNTMQAVTLLNDGSSQIAWQATSTQPWLQMSPTNGTFTSRFQVTVAVDRSQLKPGAYSGQITFVSATAGTIVLPVKMTVTPLEPAHEGILQAGPPTLNFTAGDGGAAPPAQSITLRNPGSRVFRWTASESSDWFSISPASGSLDVGGSTPIKVIVNLNNLLPGAYDGVVTINSQGGEPVQGSPQNVHVSLTINPPCTMRVVPGAISFSSAYQQGAPGAQTLNISGSQSCHGDVHWDAASSDSWLNIDSNGGNLPGHLSVSVDPSGLDPGTHNGTITINSSAGSQAIPVSFSIAPPASPSMSVKPAQMTFRTIAGQNDPNAQNVTITNSGDGNLSWSASASSSGWLLVSPSGNTLSSHNAASLGVQAQVGSLAPGSYSGTITISGQDALGHQAPGSPQQIAVTFIVDAPCSVGISPLNMQFSGVAGSATPPGQSLTIAAKGACANALNWSTVVATKDGSPWISIDASSGNASGNNAGHIGVSVNPANLAPGSYTGTVTITATDSVTGTQIGQPQVVNITFTVAAPCTLQAPSVPTLNFSTEAGMNPVAQGFSLGVIGACTGNVAVAPVVSTADGAKWLIVGPTPATTTAGYSASFSARVDVTGLTPGKYTGTITLNATSQGAPIAGTPQIVNVVLIVTAPPALDASPGSITFTVTTGTDSRPIAVNNTGGSSMNWSAVLDKQAPSWVSLGNASGKLAGGASDNIAVNIDATGVAGGNTYQAMVTVTAIDPITGKPTANSPIQITVSSVVTGPSMHLSSPGLQFNTTTGTNPAAQSLSINNPGGNSLTWTVGQPDQSWFTVSPTSGSNHANETKTIAFTVDVTGLVAGNYTGHVIITPSIGNPVTITVMLAIVDPQPSPTPTPPPTATTPPPPPLQLSVLELDFTTTTGTNPAALTLKLTDTQQSGSLSWGIDWPQGQTRAPWLTFTPATGTVDPATPAIVSFTVDVTGLAAGNYTTTLGVLSSVGGPQQLIVTLAITAPSPTPGTTPSPSPTGKVTATADPGPKPDPTPKH